MFVATVRYKELEELCMSQSGKYLTMAWRVSGVVNEAELIFSPAGSIVQRKQDMMKSWAWSLFRSRQ
jgi:hypothetical protein